MDIERDLRVHLLERAGGPIPADLTARLAARIEPRRPRPNRTVGLPLAAALAGLAAVLVVAVVLATLAVPGPTASSPTPPASVATGPTASPSAPATALASIGPSSSLSPSPTPRTPSDPSLLSHPIGATDVILSLRYESGGGIPTSDAQRLLRPSVAFVLYGDGTAVYRRSPAIFGSLLLGPRAFQMYTSRLDPAQVDHLLRFALDGSHFRVAGFGYIANSVPSNDAVLSVDADGVDRSLTISPGFDATKLPPAEARTEKALQELVQYLATFETSAAAKAAGGTSIYRADAYLAVLDLHPLGSIPKEIASSPWPWPELTVSAFGPAAAPTRTAVITPAEYDTLLALRTWYGEGMVVRGPDGRRYLLSARPLLPGEVAP